MVRASVHGAMESPDQSLMVEPLSYFLFQSVLHDWYNKGCPVFGMVHIK